MKFGEALEYIRDGTHRAYRKGWNGKGMWIYAEKGKIINSQHLRNPIKSWLNHHNMVILPHLNMKSKNGGIVVGWLVSQTDILANDWVVKLSNLCDFCDHEYPDCNSKRIDFVEPNLINKIDSNPDITIEEFEFKHADLIYLCEKFKN